MARQFFTLGSANFTPFTGFADPIASSYTPVTGNLSSNFTGAISPASGADRPLAISRLKIFFRTGGGTGSFFCSNNSTGTGSVTSTSSSISSLSGTISRGLNYPATISQQLFFGFKKTNTTTTNFSTATRTGSNVFRNGSVINSGRVIFAELRVDTLPSAVQSLSTTATSSTEISVTWSGPSDNGGTAITGYRVAYKPEASSTYEFVTTTGLSTNLTGLTASTTYDIKVGAQNAVSSVHNSTFSYTDVQAHTGTAADTTETTLVPVPVFTDSTIDSPATVGVAYSDGVEATDAESYSISAGSLPDGISLNTATGAITGTPTTAGSYSFTVSATNVSGSATAPLTLIVNPAAPVFTDSTLSDNLRRGIPYSDGVEATDAESYATTGTFVTGLTLDTATGTVTGTPTAQGTFNFDIEATNVTGTATASFSLSVKPSVRRWNGTEFVFATTFKRWNGTEFVDVTQTKRWDGTAFVLADE